MHYSKTPLPGLGSCVYKLCHIELLYYTHPRVSTFFYKKIRSFCKVFHILLGNPGHYPPSGTNFGFRKSLTSHSPSGSRMSLLLFSDRRILILLFLLLEFSILHFCPDAIKQFHQHFIGNHSHNHPNLSQAKNLAGINTNSLYLHTRICHTLENIHTNRLHLPYPIPVPYRRCTAYRSHWLHRMPSHSGAPDIRCLRGPYR